MELREWAIRILSADTMAEKLLSPSHLTDAHTGDSLRWKEPSRPQGMGFKKHTSRDKLPAFHDLQKKDYRAVCLHRFAGHELLAVEIMAFTILAFPEAPKHFRKGLANTLKEEQQHVQLYIRRLKEMGLIFGTLPLYRHFWSYTPYITSPLHYISLMSLTFEMANLDFAPLYGKAFASHGDSLSASLMEQILQDEISHVGFGWNWLKKWNEKGHSLWDTWTAHLPPRITPARAKGLIVHEDPRKKAGISTDWIERIKTARVE